MDRSNMKCSRKRKSRKFFPVNIQNTNGSIIHKLRVWSVTNPYGKNVELDMQEKTWVRRLLEAPKQAWGAHIHTTHLKWMYYKINLGTPITNNHEYLSLSNESVSTLKVVARECIETALKEVCDYKSCVRTPCANGAVWTLPCGDAWLSGLISYHSI